MPGAGVNIECRVCGGVFFVPCTTEQLQKWIAGALIQDVMPELTAGERELLISRTCNDCFARMFEGD